MSERKETINEKKYEIFSKGNPTQNPSDYRPIQKPQQQKPAK